MTYAEKLKDPRWQKKRLEILERDDFTCQICNDNKTELHVHHLYYVNDREPWDYKNESLVSLCKNCHKYEDDNKKAKDKFIKMLQRKGLFSNDFDELTTSINKFDNEKFINLIILIKNMNPSDMNLFYNLFERIYLLENKLNLK
jgi:hypothetical protein